MKDFESKYEKKKIAFYEGIEKKEDKYIDFKHKVEKMVNLAQNLQYGQNKGMDDYQFYLKLNKLENLISKARKSIDLLEAKREVDFHNLKLIYDLNRLTGLIQFNDFTRKNTIENALI